MNQGGGGNQTVTQQNIPSWAMDYAQNTLDMGRYYTNNQDYRPTSLDYNYGNLRGSAPLQRNSGRPVPTPAAPGALNGLMAQLPPDLQRGGLNIGRTPSSRGMGRSTGYNYSDGYGSGDYTYSDQGTDNYYGSDTYDGSFTDPSSYSDGYDESDSGYDITSPPAVDGGLEFSSEDSWIWGSGNSGESTDNTSSNDSSNNQTTLPAGMSQEEVQALIDKQLQQFDENTITPDEMPTPFQTYDRQRFAAPNANTLTGERLMAGRYADRFGADGTDTNPYSSAINAANRAASYTS